MAWSHVALRAWLSVDVSSFFIAVSSAERAPKALAALARRVLPQVRQESVGLKPLPLAPFTFMVPELSGLNSY